MEDHRLKSFCLVVETKSFSLAALAKHMTQSAMSRLVKNLEDELGVPLLLRKGKAVVPTAEGRIFYEHAKNILEGYARMEQDVSATASTAKGALRLGASRTPAVHFLPQALYDFSKAYPGIRIDLTVGTTHTVLQDLRGGRIDAGIVEASVAFDDVIADTVAEDEIVIIAPEDHALVGKRRVAIQDLLTEPVILPDRDSDDRGLVDAYLRDAGIDLKTVKVRMIIGDPELAVRMVQTGLGISFVSKWAVFTAVKEGTIKVLKVTGKKIRRNFSLVCAGRELTAPATAFQQFVRQYRFFVPF